MRQANRLSRGRPVIVLGIIVAAWIGGRVMLWEPPETVRPAQIAASTFMQTPGNTAGVAFTSTTAADQTSAPSPLVSAVATVPAAVPAAVVPQSAQQFGPATAQFVQQPRASGGYGLHAMPGEWSVLAVTHFVSRHGLSSAAMPWASFASNAMPRAIGLPAGRPAPASAALPLTSSASAAPRRLSADGWLLWRNGDEAALGPGVPSYGRSQLGGALRYHVAPQSNYAPQVHLRATTAIAGEEERDLAAGISVRPVPQLPLRLAAEGRVTQTRLGTELRGGAYAVSELPPLKLPGEITGEVYLQAGYVTGDFATPFIDGQARLFRQLAQSDDLRLTAGGGAWGGAQDGAARFDIGPSASVSFPLGQGQARISADYRFRVAGDAAPDSGPALTLATGF